MQTYPLNLNPSVPAVVLSVDGDLFVYESGLLQTQYGATKINVKPENGNEITLRPGQKFRLPKGEKVSRWFVRLEEPDDSELLGAIIIGSGEFDDTNSVISQVVPVQASGNFPVTIAQTVNTLAVNMQYNGSFTTSATAHATTLTVFTPASNANGVDIKSFKISGTMGASGGTFQLLAKTSAPTALGDGDVIDMFTMKQGLENYSNKDFLRVPAGKGLYIRAASDEALVYKSLLYTVL